MIKHENVAVVTGKLAGFIDNYLREFRDNGGGFQDFPDEAILYGLLEYSKYSRNDTKEERILYVHDKCMEYLNRKHQKAIVVFDEDYNYFKVLYQLKIDDLPF